LDNYIERILECDATARKLICDAAKDSEAAHNLAQSTAERYFSELKAEYEARLSTKRKSNDAILNELALSCRAEYENTDKIMQEIVSQNSEKWAEQIFSSVLQSV
jgi:hypothetical protein